MKSLKKLAIANMIIIAGLLFTAFFWSKPTTNQSVVQPSQGNSFVVLELFTSEGCSSCPPAEELLAQINKESNGKPVYVLGYHVDYFDNLGWKDVFGSAEYTRRQQRYSAWLNSQVYTPQLVVNGVKEFVGSNESDVRKAFTEQLQVKHAASLSFSAHSTEELIKIHFQTAKTQDNDEILFALVQKNGSTNVRRGENAGRNLSHVQIVRSLTKQALKELKSGDVVMKIPQHDNPVKWEVIGMVQNKRTGAISAAGKLEIPAL